MANKIDFIDKSSFSFKGKVMYDTRGVFPSFVDVNKTKSIVSKEGDEIITTSFTYVATAEAIALLKLKPVLVEVNPDTFTIDPAAFENPRSGLDRSNHWRKKAILSP